MEGKKKKKRKPQCRKLAAIKCRQLMSKAQCINEPVDLKDKKESEMYQENAKGLKDATRPLFDTSTQTLNNQARQTNAFIKSFWSVLRKKLKKACSIQQCLNIFYSNTDCK